MKPLSLLCFLFILAVLGVGCSSKAEPSLPTSTPTLAASATPVIPWKVIKTIKFEHSFLYGGFEDAGFGFVLGTIGSGHTSAIYNTTDTGSTWLRGENESQFLFGLEIVDHQVAWSCGEAGTLRRTGDGGKTWQAAGNFGDREPNQCRFLSFLDGNTGWAATPSRLALTTDAGQTWQELTLPADAGTLAGISLQTSSEGALLDATGKLFITKDGGSSWTSRLLDFGGAAFLGKMPAPIAAMRFVAGGKGSIAFLRKTTDGFELCSAQTEDDGLTWQTEQVPLEVGIENIYLSRDGKFLTVINTGLQQIILLHYQL
jgi:photosystem II stability/assembly factor-like uncharacterized protein